MVEGYFDVIALHGIGFTNAVACLGTVLTNEQVRQMLKVSSKLYLCLDSDNPGLEATNKTIKSLEFEIKNNLIDLKIISIPDKDPSDFVLRNGSKSSK
ncbi:MAG: toprim domain-containing protein, partial [Planktothrix sp.]